LIRGEKDEILPSFIVRNRRETGKGQMAYEQVVNIEVLMVAPQTTRCCAFSLCSHKNVTY
jgi:hypothetical protein